ncbi:hypothetical protein M413DRAFT_61619 [Hebeloma cylindrosporum]|uniref:ABC transporter domain-containing protein n=1 Tax=Hebeloma cylindrosporum TaxID=76867 RepID=A0A0C3CIC7_HEBCY|nr:hypothetical protein M413DRAFT_61619 [Hebeloma cylindrosporum h7]
MIKDIASLRQCWPLFAAFLAVELVTAIVPAVSVYYSGQLLTIVQTAVEHRTVDSKLLITAVSGTFISSIILRFLHYARKQIYQPLHLRIKLFYSVHIFRAMLRLDVPTFDDPAIQHQLSQASPKHSHTSIAFSAVTLTIRLISTALQLVSHVFVLAHVLRNQPDGPLLAVLYFSYSILQWSNTRNSYTTKGVWAATTSDEDYIRSEGLKLSVHNPIHRKEIVASGIAPFLLAQYQEAVRRVGDRAGDYYEVIFNLHSRQGFSASTFFQELLRSLPEIVFTLRAVQQPSTIPLSLASLGLIKQTSQSFTTAAFSLVDETGSVTEMLSSVKLLYQITQIPNHRAEQLWDPDFDPDDPSFGIPFPEDDKALELGISIEFRNVSFMYPGSNAYALRNISFKIEQGQLCVIVGNNGSGKSTILKLIARLYDPTDGQILIDGTDIRTLRLADLRRAISVLFQDYTLFPLSIRDNISLGDPPHTSDLSKIQQAAQLGGADAFIERLPEKYNTYLDRPVESYYSPLPEGTTTLFGQPVDYGRVRDASGMDGGGTSNRGLSGGQVQRIALSRTFMRSVVSDQSVGLLLFDEPSASLDPTAEHDLFERLRKLRGNKTMVFSSHRFGNLTRHADLILYMNDAVVVEEGTHELLLKYNGEYARIWKLQAGAFL